VFEQKHSPAQEAIIRVHCRLTQIGFEPSAAVVAKLLVRSPQVGCLLGKGGLVISKTWRATCASIRIFSKEQVKFISQNEEVVQVIGALNTFMWIICTFNEMYDSNYIKTNRTLGLLKPEYPNNLMTMLLVVYSSNLHISYAGQFLLWTIVESMIDCTSSTRLDITT